MSSKLTHHSAASTSRILVSDNGWQLALTWRSDSSDSFTSIAVALLSASVSWMTLGAAILAYCVSYQSTLGNVKTKPSPNLDEVSWDWVAMAGILMFVLAGFVIAYLRLSKAVNRTTITLDSKTLCLVHGPMPRAGRRTFPSEDLMQVWVQRGWGFRLRFFDMLTDSFELWVLVKGRGSIRLCHGFKQADEPLFLEQTIERWLRIADEPVKGEISRLKA